MNSFWCVGQTTWSPKGHKGRSQEGPITKSWGPMGPLSYNSISKWQRITSRQYTNRKRKYSNNNNVKLKQSNNEQQVRVERQQGRWQQTASQGEKNRFFMTIWQWDADCWILSMKSSHIFKVCHHFKVEEWGRAGPAFQDSTCQRVWWGSQTWYRIYGYECLKQTIILGELLQT